MGVTAEIYEARSTVNDQPPIRRIIEKAGVTVTVKGIPVMIDTGTGGIQVWDGTVAFGIAGFSKEFFSNLATTGTPKTLTFGNVPYQTSAVNIPEGAPLNDGRIGFAVAAGVTVFHGQVGPSQTTAVTDVGKKYGMAADSDGHYYVDKTDTSTPVVEVVALDQFDTARGVFFNVLPSSAQFIA